MKLLYKIIIPITLVLLLVILASTFLLDDTTVRVLSQQTFVSIKDNVFQEARQELFVKDFDRIGEGNEERDEHFKRFIEHTRGSLIGRVTVWNRDGIVVASDLKSIIGQTAKRQEIEDVFVSGQSRYIEKQQDSEELRQSNIGHFLDIFIPIQSSQLSDGKDASGQVVGVVEIHAPISAIRIPIQSLIQSYVVLIVGALLVILLFVFLVIRFFILRPIEKLRLGAEAMSKNNFDVAVDVHSRDELGRLAHNFEDMKEALKTLFVQMNKAQSASQSSEEAAKKNFENVQKKDKALSNILEDIAASEENLRKKTEELRKFQQAADTSFDHVIITDPDGYILYANHTAELFTGYTREEMMGQTPALWGKQMSKEFYETLWRTIKTEKNSYAGEMTNKRKDGTKYLSTLRIAPILDDKGEIQFFVGVERDITEERKSQLKIVRHAAELEHANIEIAHEKERAESILRFLRSIGEGVFATDKDGKIIFMNEAAELFSGKSFSAIEGSFSKDVFMFVRKKQTGIESLALVDRVLREKKMVTIPTKTFITRDDKETPISGTCSFIRDEQQEIIGTITVFQDITKKHELDQMKDSFLSVAAHQLRTPLGSMRWSMELLLNGDLGKLPKIATEAVQQIYDNSQRMIMLVNDLLNVERMDQNKGREEKKSMDIGAILEEVVKTMHSEGERRGLTISFKKSKPSFPAIMVPPKHFYEALENLISNSIKYNRKNGSVKITLTDEPGGLLITVKDTGIGIPKDAQSKIFSKFFRAENAVLKETEGSGLGLSVVKSYLEESGASIRFESEENVGTTFFVQLPFRPTGT